MTDSIGNRGTPVERMIKEIMSAQADLQVGLGLLRLEKSLLRERDGIQELNLATAEDHLASSLARLHKLLDALGKPMYQPATHPGVWDGP